MFANRLRKRARALARWATREGVSCYRVYERDIPEVPLAVDLYEGRLHVAEYARGGEEPHEDAWVAAMTRAAGEALDIPADRIWVKRRERQKGLAQYEKVGSERERFVVHEGGSRFWVNLSDYLDTGLFLDHRITRRRVGELAAGRRFLNLFAYTGTATVHAAGGGATASTTVDMSRTYLDWAKRNLALNGLAGPQHGFVQADCLSWLDEAAARGGPRYGFVFLDPPTASRSKRMEQAFDVQRDHVGLLTRVARLLDPGGTILFSNNYQRFNLDTAALGAFEIEDITAATIPEDYKRNPRIHAAWLLKLR